MNEEMKQSSIVDSNTNTPAENAQFSMPTWGIIGFLIVALVVLKTFIYIKDKKRHGK